VPTEKESVSLQPIAALAGWVFPGLGHLVNGNTRRGIAAMAGVLLLFVTGVLVGGIDAIDRKEDRLWFIGQAACGPIAFAVDSANTAFLKSGSAAPMIPLPPSVLNQTPQASAFKGLAHANEFGTFLVFLAGLMNLCVILDALVRAPRSDRATGSSMRGRRAEDANRTVSTGGAA
jgi:TM2 domain-containing membrane protein YozV